MARLATPAPRLARKIARESQLLPISIPTPSTNPPPSITLATAESGGVSMNRHWIQAMVASSNTTTMHAMNVAVQKFGIR